MCHNSAKRETKNTYQTHTHLTIDNTHTHPKQLRISTSNQEQTNHVNALFTKTKPKEHIYWIITISVEINGNRIVNDFIIGHTRNIIICQHAASRNQQWQENTRSWTPLTSTFDGFHASTQSMAVGQNNDRISAPGSLPVGSVGDRI